MIYDSSPQKSDSWFAIKRGVISASMFKDARDYKEPTAKQRAAGMTRGEPSAKLLLTAMNIARDRVGGKSPSKFETPYMRAGAKEEDPGVDLYEVETGNLVERVGFAYTEDRLFGCSLDGRVRPNGAIEVKLMASSETMFRCLEGDVSDFMDQVVGCHWLLPELEWTDLVLYAPDLASIGRALTIVRIHRDEAAIRALEVDLMQFARRVAEYERILRNPSNAGLAMAA